MTGEQKYEEINTIRKQIVEEKKSLQSYSRQYDLIRYNYGNQYIEDRLNLKKKIGKKTQELSILTLKLSDLTGGTKISELAWGKIF